MSVAEMQLAAIRAISRLEDEKMLKEILAYLANASSPGTEKILDLSQHYDKVKEQYEEKMATPGSETEIDDIPKHSEQLHKKAETIDLSKHLDAISEQDNETLKRLAE